MTQGVFHRCPRKALTYGGIGRDRSREHHTPPLSRRFCSRRLPRIRSPRMTNLNQPLLSIVIGARPRPPSHRPSSCQMLLHSAASPSWSSLSLSQPTRTDCCASLYSRTSALSDASARSPSRLIVFGLLVFQITVLSPFRSTFHHFLTHLAFVSLSCDAFLSPPPSSFCPFSPLIPRGFCTCLITL